MVRAAAAAFIAVAAVPLLMAGSALAAESPPAAAWLTLGDGVFYQASLRMLVILFVLAILIESALAVVFNWRLFQVLFYGRGVKTLVSIAISALAVWSFKIDVVHTMLALYGFATSGTEGGTLSRLLTALILAGGSAGVYRVLVALGYREARTADDIQPKPKSGKAWICRSGRSDGWLSGGRFRRELGDIASLASSIVEVGLLHPVVVTPDGRLIAGERRLAAFRQLGRPSVSVRVVPIDDILRGEFDENAVRADFLPSEYVAITRVLENEEQRQARVRQGTRTDKHPGKLPEGSTGRVNDKIAKAARVSRRTLEKAGAVADAAERAPERFGKLVEEMDRTGKVNGVFQKLVVAQKADAIRQETPPLPRHGPYRVLVADPPWPYEKRSLDASKLGICPYPPMSIEETSALPVASLTHDDAILWLWTTNAHLRAAFGVLDAWGFRQKTILTWAKNRIGTGDWLRGQTEHCLLAVRGKPTVQLTNQTTVLHASAGAHSAKPDAFYALVEALCPAPRYAELFQRKPRENWDGHGDEA